MKTTVISVALITLLALVISLAVVGAADAAEERYASKQFDGRRLGNQAWQYRWQVWLPAKARRVFHCETPTNGQYINWQHNSGTYQGGPGFYHGTWDQFKPVHWWPKDAHLATPWQQWVVAKRVHSRYGWSGWGCRGA